ncbi:MAG TPA: TIGR03619 family F420-dependent LLM class oxidoreductase [Candidatus Limnocylindria bacterium]|nr:TIGR03619 family F420-dependent LLM class oxidoreductase [Candidatus Limnocylindria bacterium]
MKFSVALPSAYEGLGYPIGMVRDPAVFARLARAAESLGYDAVWANDHLSTPRFLRGAGGGRPSFYEPLVTLAHLAAVTARIGLGTAVLALPLRDPVLLAKQLATLDVLSRGRLVAGVGLGAYPEELAAVRPGRAGPRAARFDELLAALRTLLDEGGGTYRGRTVRFADVELAPAPLQRPLPLYIGGHGTEAVARAARWGQGWMPGWRPLGELRERVALLRDRLVAAGRDPRAVAVAPELSASIARRHEDAVARYESSRFVRHRRARDRTGRDASLMTASNLVGSAEAVRARVAALAEAGVDHCAALAFPAESVDELLEQWQAFAEDVMRPVRASVS